MTLKPLVVSTLLAASCAQAQEDVRVVTSLAELAEAAALTGQSVRVAAGTYRMADYLTDEVLQQIRDAVDRTQKRPPVPMFVFRGDGNRFDFRDVVIEIDTTLYDKVPEGGYTRCLIIAGSGNHLEGLTIRSTGPNQGSNGNILSVQGASNTLQDVTLHVYGSSPYGYGDLLGKGGPNLVPLKKQSGIQVLGAGTTLRRCKVFSRAFGHCFYIQVGDDILLEDCYAEGALRSTSEMLGETSGMAYDLGFRAVNKNRDGRYLITPGYMKSLSEDGFRTYGGAGQVKLVNCMAVHTRAGFEIGAKDDSPRKTILENCIARGCERAFLLGSHVIVRRCRGDLLYGPLLYLRGGTGSDIELELAGGSSDYTVHALATIAGSGHRVRLTAQPHEMDFLKLPVLLGYGMPKDAEMASPIEPLAASGIDLHCGLAGVAVITSALASNNLVEARGSVVAAGAEEQR